MISQTNNQFDQLKLEKKHKKAVAREDEYAKVNVERTKKKTVTRSSALDPDDEFSLRDQAYYNLARQNRAMEEFVNQQQKNS